MSQTRRLAAILAADVAGYSRLMGADAGGGAGDHARSRQRGARDRHRSARSERAYDPGKGRSHTAAKMMDPAGEVVSSLIRK